MLNIGCHLSVSKGFEAMGKEALKINANTFQFFTRNPRGSKAKAIDPKDAEGLLEIVKKNQFATLLAHAPYTLNPCSAEEKTREFAAQVMADDLARMEYLPNNLYNFHPGSHVGQGVDVGIELITSLLNMLLKPEQTTTVLLETMAGKGTEVGRTFEELKRILDGITLSEKVGICLDTCHVYDGGYDLVNDLEGVFEKFDQVIGLDKLRAIHLNDDMNPMSSHKDRHAKIGEGSLGLEAITRIINHPKLRHLPFFLETPNDLAGYAKEIALLRGVYKE
ncbi:deoxyribonuclease IV [Desulfitobacterium metallireducens]|uniref:Probable endonuclease 4 n=1 Tax=Desulfitobacterium metallireducens DSM 15288 TaxID=871968 RepID=W0EBV8_9FIRM|nr:deoxyribonuclease IV [Desulfitobacterium metallireducens]AHF06561.1 endonuclease IV [Desulfitobacterium metallireducens DSM 15288]